MKYDVYLEISSKIKNENMGDIISDDNLKSMCNILRSFVVSPGKLKFNFKKDENAITINVNTDLYKGDVTLRNGGFYFQMLSNNYDFYCRLNEDLSQIFLRYLVDSENELKGIYEYVVDRKHAISEDRPLNEVTFAKGKLLYYDEETMKYISDNNVDPKFGTITSALEPLGIEPDYVEEEAEDLNKVDNNFRQNASRYLAKQIKIYKDYPKIVREKKPKTL